MAKLFYFTATARNSNLQDVIHMCCMYVASICLDFPRTNEMHRTQFDYTCGPSITRYLMTCVLTVCHVKLTQSTAVME